MSNMSQCSKPLVSVIVPVYGTEKLLRRCLDSIINQTYKKLEIIVVNDCSPGNCADIVKEYSQIDNRIKYVEHEKNRGLFRARLTGAKQMTGDYIAFVDSDDYLAVDFYRLLVKSATEERADIVCGNMIMVNEDGKHYIQLYNQPPFKKLRNDDIIQAFFDQEGLAFHWHCVWNKLYSKKIWEKAVPYYEKLTEHLIMAEDFAYSAVLFYYAKKYTTIEYEGYYYYQNTNASTSLAGNVNKYLKNLKDLKIAFDFVESFLRDKNVFDIYGDKFAAWKMRYSRFWTDNINNSGLNMIDKQKAFKQLFTSFDINEPKKSVRNDHFFYSMRIDWDSRYEDLKKAIIDNKHHVISFDIFDTLITRPFMEPHDLFLLLDDIYEQATKCKPVVKFSKYREDAEALLRKEIKVLKSHFEEITLDEIYEYLVKNYGIASEVAEFMKLKEIELEIHFSQQRRSAKEIYDLAIDVGKKVIIVSDMYLPRETIEKILNKNGYQGYDKLYLSSELRLSKHEGTLYEYVKNDLRLTANQIMHIGDNWDSDIVNAEKHGLATYFFPKTIERLFNHIPDKETGNSTLLYFQPRGYWINYEYAKDYLLIRSMLAISANKYFDNPYKSFHPNSDFNGDPYFMGYYALGMHLIAVSKWLIEQSSEQKYNKIHFVARDGFLPKKIYDLISKCYSTAPKSNYLYLSRKSLIPALLEDMDSLRSIDQLINIYAYSPKRFLQEFMKVDDQGLLEARFRDQGIIMDKNFNNRAEFNMFINSLEKFDLDYSTWKDYQVKVKKYLLQEVKDNEAIFDIGYSGTSQMIMANMGVKVDGFYIHINNDTAYNYSKKLGYHVATFYSYSPAVSGTIREYIFSEIAPSCIGYDDFDGDITPVLEEDTFTYTEKFIVGRIHKGAEEFATDIVDQLSQYIPSLTIRHEDASMPYELFLQSSKEQDKRMFAECYFEDDAYHGESDINLKRQWTEVTEYFQTKPVDISTVKIMRESGNIDFLENRSKYLKAMFYFIFDRHTFKSKVKAKLSGRPILLKSARFVYASMRSVKRFVFGPRHKG